MRAFFVLGFLFLGFLSKSPSSRRSEMASPGGRSKVASYKERLDAGDC